MKRQVGLLSVLMLVGWSPFLANETLASSQCSDYVPSQSSYTVTQMVEWGAKQPWAWGSYYPNGYTHSMRWEELDRTKIFLRGEKCELADGQKAEDCSLQLVAGEYTVLVVHETTVAHANAHDPVARTTTYLQLDEMHTGNNQQRAIEVGYKKACNNYGRCWLYKLDAISIDSSIANVLTVKASSKTLLSGNPEARTLKLNQKCKSQLQISK